MANNIAPDPSFPERPGTVFERKPGSPTTNFNSAREGDLRFQEGIGTDTDVPSDLQHGILDGYTSAPGRPNRNAVVWDKPAAETMKERAHLGSAAWVDAPDVLGEFAQGSFADYATNEYEQLQRDGGHYMRPNHAVVED